MKLLVEFDVDADLIEVPEQIVAERELYRKRFWKWLSNRSIRHKYWVEVHDSDGNTFTGLQYRSDAFVEWLNNKVLKIVKKRHQLLQQTLTSKRSRILYHLFIFDFPILRRLSFENT